MSEWERKKKKKSKLLILSSNMCIYFPFCAFVNFFSSSSSFEQYTLVVYELFWEACLIYVFLSRITDKKNEKKLLNISTKKIFSFCLSKLRDEFYFLLLLPFFFFIFIIFLQTKIIRQRADRINELRHCFNFTV